MTAFHPDLAAAARWLPRWLVRPWTRPMLRLGDRLTAWATGQQEHAVLDNCRLYVYRPKLQTEGDKPGVVWMHGGGLVIGTARQDDAFAQRLADDLGAIVASVEYRLAPEHPFPAPLEDCVDAFDWLAAQPDVDATRIAIAGASAGGSLAAALCLRLRDRGGPQPVHQALLYPMLDDRSSAGSGPNDASFRLWDRTSNTFGWDSYLKGYDRSNPPAHAVPSRSSDLAGLPPAWIGVGTLDLFVDEDVAYAETLRAAAVEVDLDVVDGAYHGFDAISEKTPVASNFRQSMIASMARRLHP